METSNHSNHNDVLRKVNGAVNGVEESGSGDELNKSQINLNKKQKKNRRKAQKQGKPSQQEQREKIPTQVGGEEGKDVTTHPLEQSKFQSPFHLNEELQKESLDSVVTKNQENEKESQKEMIAVAETNSNVELLKTTKSQQRNNFFSFFRLFIGLSKQIQQNKIKYNEQEQEQDSNGNSVLPISTDPVEVPKKISEDYVEDLNDPKTSNIEENNKSKLPSPPVWHKDEDHLVCEIPDCGKKFTFTFRRHHCRRCGCVVCKNCSKTFVELPEFGIKNKVRICTRCKSEIEPNQEKKNEIKSINNVENKEQKISQEEEEKEEEKIDHNEDPNQY